MAHLRRLCATQPLVPGLIGLLLCLGPTSAGAADAPTAQTGDDTHAWLQLQASGSEAEGEARPMSGDVADAVYQRYLESFRQPIPQQLSDGTGGNAGSASGGSQATAASGSTPP